MADEHLMSLQPGTVIAGRYEVVKCLGAGSMGLVYACRHRELSGHMVAVKVLFPEVAQDKTAAARFRNEIFASYGVSHPNVVRAYEYLRDGDIVAYTMEFVGGGDLAERLGRGGDLVPIEQAIKILAQMCSGVQAIHDAGIVHRDLKPENILLTKDGQVKIADFGIARTGHGPKLTEHGGVVGTIDYVSPEYMLNSQVDWRSDIYAIGILGYEMLTGESPFRGDSVYATMTKRLKSDPKPPSALRSECPRGLDAIVLRAMERDPEKRYQSAAEMFFDLSALLPDGVSVGGGLLQVSRNATQTYRGPALERGDAEPIGDLIDLDDHPLDPPVAVRSQTPEKPPPPRSRGVGTEVALRPLERQPSLGASPFSAVGAASQASLGRPMLPKGSATAPATMRSSIDYSDAGAQRYQETQVIRADAVFDEISTPDEEDTLHEPIKMERVLAYQDLVSEGWTETKPIPARPVTVGRVGIDDVRLRTLSEVVDRMNRSIWVDVLTLVLIVLVGVGVGFTLLKIFIPDIRPEASSTIQATEELYE
jgi:serine/threonine protein kinase